MAGTLYPGYPRRDENSHLQLTLSKAGYDLEPDGIFGKKTERAVLDFQRKNGLVADGIVGQKTWVKLSRFIPDPKEEDKYLSEEDLEIAAERLDVDLATIKAVNEVESKGTGFIGDKPKILFEGHVFWRQLKLHDINPWDYKSKLFDNVLYESSDRTKYIGGIREHDRLETAMQIHKGAALESASWGLFQIMGFHWEDLGYESADEFVKKMYQDEAQHLIAFVKFIESNGLASYLKEQDWKGFAKRYNGPAYKSNRYDSRLKTAYEKYKNMHIKFDKNTGEVFDR